MRSGKKRAGWWRGLDSNQRRLSQRIYSPSPLTTRAPLQAALNGAVAPFSIPVKGTGPDRGALCKPLPNKSTPA